MEDPGHTIIKDTMLEIDSMERKLVTNAMEFKDVAIISQDIHLLILVARFSNQMFGRPFIYFYPHELKASLNKYIALSKQGFRNGRNYGE